MALGHECAVEGHDLVHECAGLIAVLDHERLHADVEADDLEVEVGVSPQPLAPIPAEIADAMCVQYRPGDGAACAGLQLPESASALAYRMCLEYHKLDVKACKDLRMVYEAELRAYLERPQTTPNPVLSPANEPQITGQRARDLHKTAEDLYKATSRDAQTFEAALLIPDVRQKVQGVLRHALSDEELRKLADQARAEALYWYKYMQGLERIPNIYYRE